MKKLLATIIALGMGAALPALAADTTTHAKTQKTVYTERTVYHSVEVPLTPEQVAERQHMITKIEKVIKRVDQNGDHMISYDEYSTPDQPLHKDSADVKTSFKRLDTNSDGQLSSQEILEGWVAEHEKAHMPVVSDEESDVVTYTSSR
jgi:hypothetical protein